ncbi:MAG: (deoxy)nucleoside triphosphate pyrophosphohydrolase [Desulfobacterales bacterium]|nr:(deoxy)nucleoside triphosphate pyrophosphohydrolase [Desulfobacterales bacterium]
MRESGEVLIQKRPATGHLAGMWEFPGGKVLDGESHEQALCRSLHDELGLAVEVKGAVGVASHAYSHFKVRVFLYLCRASESFQKVRQGRKGQPVSWVVAGGLDALAFPAVNRKLFPLLRPYLEHS